jgi:hypothetical protein
MSVIQILVLARLVQGGEYQPQTVGLIGPNFASIVVFK